MIDWISRRVRSRYARQPRFDTGEHDERRVESTLRPRSNNVTAAPQHNGTPAIPLGSRVQDRRSPRWVGTVTAWDPEAEFPYRVAFDNGVVDDLVVGELIQLTRPHAVPAGTLEHYRQLAVAAGLLEASLDGSADYAEEKP